ncbi:hypothetical protein [Nonomuraea insulae]|uniref:AAA+ ATPase domain-containing protein n=1 Tax=Nonomuraea insulae TaxID=1616787 RepID=A0ABW1D7X2_9ACTN
MTVPVDPISTELPVVRALRSLSIFSADQGGAYREHFALLAETLGRDIDTKLGRHVTTWAIQANPGVMILTGNAGTGKTAIAECYCQALDRSLPNSDELMEVSPGRWVVKDLSGLPSSAAREATLRRALIDAKQDSAQFLICANEGVLRDVLNVLDLPAFKDAVERALRTGAFQTDGVTVVNVNRQRPTAEGLWQALLDYLTREDMWDGCADCPLDRGGCPMRSNAAALRDPGIRAQLRTLVRLGVGDAVPTMRETLAILSWAIVGGQGCPQVKAAVRDLDKDAFHATSGYFTRVMGGGLSPEVVERSPLLSSIRGSGLGEVSDLEIDGWLRDTTGAPDDVRRLAGDPQVLEQSPNESDARGLAGSRSPLDRVRTKQGTMTFHFLGETVSTSEDPTKVEDGLDALVAGDGQSNAPAQMLWRQRLYFEAAHVLGGHTGAARRLLSYRYLPDLIELAHKAADGGDTMLELTEIVRGLNFLVTGFSSPHEGLVVPDPACLFARDPGAFRPARPSLVHGQVHIDRLAIAVPDRGLVQDLLDVDHVDVDLTVDDDRAIALRIRPQMYEAIREAAEFQGPVGQGVAEMNDLRGFYGRVAYASAAEQHLRVADPESSPPALVRVNLPYFSNKGAS